ncbi:hypothetical protein HDU76_005495, partial [Blyttiomyces sp. JEL0837]
MTSSSTRKQQQQQQQQVQSPAKSTSKKPKKVVLTGSNAGERAAYAITDSFKAIRRGFGLENDEDDEEEEESESEESEDEVLGDGQFQYVNGFPVDSTNSRSSMMLQQARQGSQSSAMRASSPSPQLQQQRRQSFVPGVDLARSRSNPTLGVAQPNQLPPVAMQRQYSQQIPANINTNGSGSPRRPTQSSRPLHPGISISTDRDHVGAWVSQHSLSPRGSLDSGNNPTSPSPRRSNTETSHSSHSSKRQSQMAMSPQVRSSNDIEYMGRSASKRQDQSPQREQGQQQQQQQQQRRRNTTEQNNAASSSSPKRHPTTTAAATPPSTPSPHRKTHAIRVNSAPIQHMPMTPPSPIPQLHQHQHHQQMMSPPPMSPHISYYPPPTPTPQHHDLYGFQQNGIQYHPHPAVGHPGGVYPQQQQQQQG